MILELLHIFIDNIAPILIVSGFGYALGRWQQMDSRSLGRIIFYIFSPALIFDSLLRNQVSLTELIQIALILTVVVLAVTGLSYLVVRVQTPNRIERASIMLTAICSNNGNFGLPLIGFAFDERVLARAVLCYVALTFLNYAVGVFVASSGQGSPRQALVSVLRVPAIYASAAAFLITLLGLELPPVVTRSVALMGQGSIPALLILLGIQLSQAAAITRLRLTGSGVLLRLIVSPVLAAALVALVGVAPPTSTAIIMQAAMPAAIVTIIFATEYGLDTRLVSSAILATTLLSPLTLSVLILLLH